jgi:ribosome-binding protein aMBF1 (putative translation factor)
MTESNSTSTDHEWTEPDDLERYVATLSETEKSEVAAAEVAIDIAILLHRAREQRGLSQAAAAAQTGFAQQAVSRMERPRTNVQIATLQRYLGALGYEVEIRIKEPSTGEVAGSVSLPPHSSAA